MRPKLRIEVVESNKIFVQYQGIIDPHLRFSTAAQAFFSETELDAVMAHELGHYHGYHAEQHAAWLVVTIALVIVTPWWAIFPLLVANWLHRLAFEIEADRYSMRCGMHMDWALLRLAQLKMSWLGRLQLRLRWKALK